MSERGHWLPPGPAAAAAEAAARRPDPSPDTVLPGRSAALGRALPTAAALAAFVALLAVRRRRAG